MSLSQEIVNYALQAFPNASTLLQEILSKYARELTTTAAFGLVALWEFIYDRLFERDPQTIHITAASERVGEASASSSGSGSGSAPNGYSPADKSVIEKILDKTDDKEKKNQLTQYRKTGTLEDAIEDFKKFSGDAKDKGSNVWVKELPYGKTLTVREESTYEAKATLEIQKPNTKGALIPRIKIRYV
jgi:hypothetical protein